jgi:F0F1-type ATP synthase assembly protein I
MTETPKSTATMLAKAYRDAAPYLNIGWFFVIAVLLFAYIGHLVDEDQGHKSIFTLAGALLGMLLGFLNLYKTMAFLKRKK